MLKKKKISKSTLTHNQSPPTPSLSRLEKITQLEKEVISILGPKNIVIDQDKDLFSRIEELYLKHLQKRPLGLQFLQKIVRLIGDAEAPAKIKMIYMMAHQVYISGGDPTRCLLQGFNANLNSKHKSKIGFQCGLLVAKLSQSPHQVEYILNNLVVALQRQIGFRPLGVRQKKLQNQSKTSVETIKSVYIGSHFKRKSLCKSSYQKGKLEKIQLSKCLYEAYIVGCKRLQSQAKRRYYQDCRVQFKRRLIRQNPGFSIDQKLTMIQEGNGVISRFKGTLIQEQLIPKEDSLKTQRRSFSHCSNENKQYIASSNGFKENKIKEERLTNSYGEKSFKIELRSNNYFSRMTSKSVQGDKKEPPLKQIPNTSQVKENEKENKRSIVLKFDKLRNREEQRKTQLRRKKFMVGIQFQDRKVQKRSLVNVFNLNCVPSVKEETSQDAVIQTEIQTQKIQNLINNKVYSDHPSDSLRSITEQASCTKIDMILKEGIQEIAKLDQKVFEINKDNDYLKIEQQKLINTNTKIEQEEQASLLYIKSEGQNQTSFHQNQISFTKNVDDEHGQFLLKEELSEEQSVEYKIVVNSQQLPKDQICRNILQIDSAEQQRESALSLKKQNYLASDIVTSHIILDEFQIGVSKLQKEKKEHQEKIGDIVYKTNQNSHNEEQISEQNRQDIVSLSVSQMKDDGNLDDNPKKQEQNASKTEIYINYTNGIIVEQQVLNNIENISNQTINNIIRNQQHIIQQQEQRKQFKLIQEQQVNKYITNLVVQIAQARVSNEIELIQQLAFHDQFQTKQLKSSQPLATIIQNQDQTSNLFSTMNKLANQNDQINQSGLDNAALQIKTIPSEESQKANTPKFTIQRRQSNKNRSQVSSRFCEESQKYSLGNILGDFLLETTRHLTVKTAIEGDTACVVQQIPSLRRSHKRTMTENKNKPSLDLDSVGEHQGSKINFCISFDQSASISNEQTQRFQNLWLNTDLKLSSENLQILIKQNHSDGRLMKKIIALPDEILKSYPDVLKRIQYKVQQFVKEQSQQNKHWQEIETELQRLNFLPEELKTTSIQVQDSVTHQTLNLTFYFRINTNQIFIKCQERPLKILIPEVGQNGEIHEILQKIDHQQVLIKQGQIFFDKIWSLLDNRKINLRDTVSKKINQYLFKVCERFDLKSNCFEYKIKSEKAESVSFKGISFDMRRKIYSNLDTIIGFILKKTNQKVYLSGQNIDSVIKLL